MGFSAIETLEIFIPSFLPSLFFFFSFLFSLWTSRRWILAAIINLVHLSIFLSCCISLFVFLLSMLAYLLAFLLWQFYFCSTQSLWVQFLLKVSLELLNWIFWVRGISSVLFLQWPVCSFKFVCSFVFSLRVFWSLTVPAHLWGQNQAVYGSCMWISWPLPFCWRRGLQVVGGPSVLACCILGCLSGEQSAKLGWPYFGMPVPLWYPTHF